MAEVRETIAGIRAAVAGARERSPGAPVVLTPTMGALHAGHLAHVRRARELGGIRVVSVFVNPLQFGQGEDLERYPRTWAADLEALEEEGVDLVFAPGTAEMYPDGPAAVRVAAGEAGTRYEGRSRPGHFDGMLTVVAKLLHIVGPDVATFGAKDAQQLHLVRRMVRDLDLPTRIEAIPIVREPDGLALSSRNAYLSPADRAAAAAIPAALRAAREARGGEREALAAARAVLEATPAVRLDYLVIVDPETFDRPAPGHAGPALLLLAARVGETRLIDNETLDLA